MSLIFGTKKINFDNQKFLSKKEPLKTMFFISIYLGI